MAKPPAGALLGDNELGALLRLDALCWSEPAISAETGCTPNRFIISAMPSNCTGVSLIVGASSVGVERTASWLTSGEPQAMLMDEPESTRVIRPGSTGTGVTLPSELLAWSLATWFYISIMNIEREGERERSNETDSFFGFGGMRFRMSFAIWSIPTPD